MAITGSDGIVSIDDGAALGTNPVSAGTPDAAAATPGPVSAAKPTDAPATQQVILDTGQGGKAIAVALVLIATFFLFIKRG